MLLKNISLKDPLKQVKNVVSSFKVLFFLLFILFINCLVFFEAELGDWHDGKIYLKVKQGLKNTTKTFKTV